MQVTDHCHTLTINFSIPVTPERSLDRSVNVFLLYGKRIVLIDTGVARSIDTIFDYIRGTGRDPAEISWIILTHAHPDHIGDARAIQSATGCRTACHEADRRWVERPDEQSRERPIPGFHDLVGGGVAIDRTLGHGDTFDAAGGLPIDVLHTPGHSPGSISLLLGSDRVLITGDAVPIPGSLPIYDDYLDSLRSIESLKQVGGVEFLLSSWAKPRRGAEIGELLEGSRTYLLRIHELVARYPGARPMEICRAVAGDLGLPPEAATPHLARTFMAHTKALGTGQ